MLEQCHWVLPINGIKMWKRSSSKIRCVLPTHLGDGKFLSIIGITLCTKDLRWYWLGYIWFWGHWPSGRHSMHFDLSQDEVNDKNMMSGEVTRRTSDTDKVTNMVHSALLECRVKSEKFAQNLNSVYSSFSRSKSVQFISTQLTEN